MTTGAGETCQERGRRLSPPRTRRIDDAIGGEAYRRSLRLQLESRA
jgi:hypothetical protein